MGLGVWLFVGVWSGLWGCMGVSGFMGGFWAAGLGFQEKLERRELGV